MKILGIISFIFGLGLLAFAGYGMYKEGEHSSTFGISVIVLLFIAAIAVITFVIGTFSRTKIYNRTTSAEDVLDLPDHIVQDEEVNGVSAFVIGCGIISMITAALTILFTVYAIYTYVSMLDYVESAHFRIEFLVTGGFCITSLSLLIYCIRKLFFSRK